MSEPVWLYVTLGATFFLAALAASVASRLSRAQQSQHSAQRWFQGQMDRIENEQRSLEAALVGLGRHIDDLDERLRKSVKRYEQIESRLDALSMPDEGERGFTHALRLAAQGRVTARELIDDFGLSESEADLVMRMNQAGGGPTAAGPGSSSSR